MSDENFAPPLEAVAETASTEPVEETELSGLSVSETLAEAAAAAEKEAIEEVMPPPPRPVFKGIHPELLCHCPECEPDFVELTWFSPEEKAKVKGQIMIYCPFSGRKYFSPAVDLHAWLAPRQTGKRARGDA